jgi:thiol-disulfide isomerase/thioredoxin
VYNIDFGNIIELDDNSWEKFVEKAEKPVFVMFSSPTCPFCKQMRPSFEEYAIEYKDDVVFATVDIVKTPTVAAKYGVMGTPTFKFFCKGRPIREVVGVMYPALLKKAVEDSLEFGPDCAKNTTWRAPDISGYE